MKIYIDSNYCCHITNDGSMREIEIDFFNNKCKAFIEGYRYIPAGESWTRTDGAVFYGEVIVPAKNYRFLAAAQQQYKIDEINHLNELGALIEDLYNADLEVIG